MEMTLKTVKMGPIRKVMLTDKRGPMGTVTLRLPMGIRVVMGKIILLQTHRSLMVVKTGNSHPKGLMLGIHGKRAVVLTRVAKRNRRILVVPLPKLSAR